MRRIFATLVLFFALAPSASPSTVELDVPSHCRIPVLITLQIVRDERSGLSREEALAGIERGFADGSINEDSYRFTTDMINFVYDNPPEDTQDGVGLVRGAIAVCEELYRHTEDPDSVT